MDTMLCHKCISSIPIDKKIDRCIRNGKTYEIGCGATCFVSRDKNALPLQYDPSGIEIGQSYALYEIIGRWITKEEGEAKVIERLDKAFPNYDEMNYFIRQNYSKILDYRIVEYNAVVKHKMKIETHTDISFSREEPKGLK